MSILTSFLGLLKKDPATDGADTFNIETMLNENWDKIDTAVSNLDTEKADAAALEMETQARQENEGLVENADGELSSICYAQNRIIIGETVTFNLGGLSPDGLKFLYGTAGSAVVYFRNTTWDTDTDASSITLPSAISQLIVMDSIALGIYHPTGTVYAMSVTESGLELLNTTTGLSFNTLSTLTSGVGMKDCINYLLFSAYNSADYTVRVFKVNKTTGVAAQVCIAMTFTSVPGGYGFLPYGDEILVVANGWTTPATVWDGKLLRITADGTITTLKSFGGATTRMYAKTCAIDTVNDVLYLYGNTDGYPPYTLHRISLGTNEEISNTTLSTAITNLWWYKGCLLYGTSMNFVVDPITGVITPLPNTPVGCTGFTVAGTGIALTNSASYLLTEDFFENNMLLGFLNGAPVRYIVKDKFVRFGGVYE